MRLPLPSVYVTESLSFAVGVGVGVVGVGQGCGMRELERRVGGAWPWLVRRGAAIVETVNRLVGRSVVVGQDRKRLSVDVPRAVYEALMAAHVSDGCGPTTRLRVLAQEWAEDVELQRRVADRVRAQRRGES